MRSTIRLSGRRQLAVGDFDFEFKEINGKLFATLAVLNPDVQKHFPGDAEVVVKLTENKLVEILRFGTLGDTSPTVELKQNSLMAPSCQIRFVNRAEPDRGRLLGSTKSWTYKSDGASDGILLFQTAKTAPRLWRLDVRAEEYPILYIDERIPDAALWAKSDYTFMACVLPQVVTKIFQDIFASAERPEGGWRGEWVSWAEKLMPGSLPPYLDEDKQNEWIENLIDSFCGKHKLAEGLISKMLSAAQ